LTPPASSAALQPAAALEPVLEAVPAAPEARPGPSAATGRPGLALFAFALSGFCSFLGFNATMPILPLLQRVFGVTKAEAGLTVSAPAIAVALASPFIGLLAQRHGHRRVIVAALLVLPVPTLLAATAPTLHALVVWRFLQGLAVPGIYAVTMAYLASEWPPDGLGRAMAALVTGNVIGGFTGRFLSGVAADHLGGWRAPFVVLGVLTAIAAVTATRLLPRDGARGAGRAATPERARPRDVLGEPRLLATFGVGFMVLFSLTATFTWVTFHLSAPPFSLGTSALSYLFTVYLVGAVITPLSGPWIDRVGSRQAITVALGAAVAGGALTLAPSLPLVVLGLTAISTAAFVAQAASTTYLRTAAPARARSAASGLYVSLYYVGGAMGGVVPALAWKAGGWTACVAFIASVQIAAILLARRAWRPSVA
jgi:predicted MFS family arabinose efflux permease